MRGWDRAGNPESYNRSVSDKAGSRERAISLNSKLSELEESGLPYQGGAGRDGLGSLQ